MSQRLNVVRLYTALRAARFGSLTQPMPGLPYPGMSLRLTALFARPVVRALRDFMGLGVRIPIFMSATLPAGTRLAENVSHQLRGGLAGSDRAVGGGIAELVAAHDCTLASLGFDATRLPRRHSRQGVWHIVRG